MRSYSKPTFAQIGWTLAGTIANIILSMNSGNLLNEEVAMIVEQKHSCRALNYELKRGFDCDFTEG